MAQPAGLNGGTTFDRIKAIAQERMVEVADRKARAEQEVHRFKSDWQKAVNAPGSRLGLGRDQVDYLRELLQSAIVNTLANPLVGSAEETAVFQHALDVLNQGLKPILP